MCFRLRDWQHGDADWYIAARDEEILRWTTEPEQLTVSEFRDGVERLDGTERAGFAVSDAATDLVGNVAAVRRGSVAELMFWVAAEARGRGVATFALSAMSSWVASNWPVTRLELQINPANAGSIAVAERVGYEYQEERKSCLSCAGPEGTVAIYARLVIPAVG